LTTIIVGASAGVGRALTHEFARRRHDLLLVSRDEEDINALARDVTLRFGVRAETVAADLAAPREAVAAIGEVAGLLGHVNALLVPAGVAFEHDVAAADPELIERIVTVNFVSVALLAAEFLHRMQATGGGAIVGFGSIAAARGRERNAVYAASKRALASYFESLRHAAAGTNVAVSFYQLGYVATQAAFGKRLLVRATTPERVATQIAARLYEDRGTVYFPWYWRPLTLALRILPWFVFKRLSF
jgi:short-subunit dehydrogenase